MIKAEYLLYGAIALIIVICIVAVSHLAGLI
jgi:hypothetical protein